MITVYVDGLCEPCNPNGVACWGFVIYRDGEKVTEGRGVVGEGAGMSSNLAEYSALANSLRVLISFGWENEEVIVRTDSSLVANQMSGRWKVHGGMYLPAYLEAKQLAKRFKRLSFQWIPRRANKEADSLSRKAYREFIGKGGDFMNGNRIGL